LSDRRFNENETSEQWAPLNPAHVETEDLSAESLRYEAFKALYETMKASGSTAFEPMYAGGRQPEFKANPVLVDNELEDRPFSDVPAVEPEVSESMASAPPAEEPQASSPPDTGEDAAAQRQSQDALLADAIAKGEKDGYQAGFAKGETEGFTKGEAEGYEAGLKKGREEGYEAGLVSAGEQLSFLEQLLTEMDGIRTHMVQRFEKEIMQMICRISEKVVYTEVHINHEVVKGAILQAFAEMAEFEEVTISVNPEDYDFIQIVKADFFKQYKDLKQISVLSNASIARGGCKIETHTGQVETSLESRLEAVKNSILNVSGSQV
jgi:flagellar assembly protein FliH